MALPPFRNDNWLPVGHHSTTWDEIKNRFAGQEGSQRALVYASLVDWRDKLRQVGITGLLILDGSFISAKDNPGDFDTILVMDEGIEVILANNIEASLLVNYSYCKMQGWGDVFVFSEVAVRKFPTMCRLDGFDHDKLTKQPKGVVEVRI